MKTLAHSVTAKLVALSRFSENVSSQEQVRPAALTAGELTGRVAALIAKQEDPTEKARSGL